MKQEMKGRLAGAEELREGERHKQHRDLRGKRLEGKRGGKEPFGEGFKEKKKKKTLLCKGL